MKERKEGRRGGEREGKREGGKKGRRKKEKAREDDVCGGVLLYMCCFFWLMNIEAALVCDRAE